MRFISGIFVGFVVGGFVLAKFSPSQAQSVHQAQSNAAVCRANLATSIQSVTEQPQFRQARWGILVQTLSATPQTLYAQDSDKLFIPASNVKLLTTAAALTELGANFRFHTAIHQIPRTDQTILQVVGESDPSLNNAQLQALARQIYERGIRQIDQLVAEEDYGQTELVNPSWEWEDIQAGYGAPVNSLILNQNAINLTLIPQQMGQRLGVQWDEPTEAVGWQIENYSRTVAPDGEEFVQVGRDLSQPILYVQGQLRVGSASEPVSISIPQPTQHFLARFQQILAAQQIQVKQTQITNRPPPATAQIIASMASAPLAQLLIETNQNSNNLYAEVWSRTLGIRRFPQRLDRITAGTEATKAALAELGIAQASEYELKDGSGLSRQNAVSPMILVHTLQAMARLPEASTYQKSLALAGVSGTLKNRFQDSPVQGKFYGKTGSLNGVAALSGYLESTNASPLVASILVNHFQQSTSEIHAAMDQIVQLLASGSC